MRSLRLPRLWIAFSVLLMLFTLWMFLKPLSGGLGSWLDFPNSDKVLHAGAFLGIVGWFGSLFEVRRWRAVALCALLYGVLIEIAQGLMPFGRDADVMDVLADSFGIVLGLLAARLFGALLLDWIDRLLTRLVR